VKKYGQAVGNVGAWAKVPLLENSDDYIVESEAVTEYVIRNVEGPGRVDDDRMYPLNDPTACQCVDSFLRKWYPVVDKYYGVLCATSEKEVRSKQQKFVTSLFELEKELCCQGDFILGDTFSLGECIAAPWVQRFFVTLPYFRAIDFETDVLKENGLDRTCAWMRAVRERPSVLRSKCPEDEILAAAVRYYVSYVSPAAPGTSRF
jgi:glutathione S-transferase